MSAVGDLVTGVTIRTRYLPDIVLDHPFDTSGQPNPVLDFLKPQITINTRVGSDTSSPYGDPGPTQWPVVQLFILGGIAALVVYLVKRK